MTLIQTPEYPWRFQVDPIYSGAHLTSAAITQFYQFGIVDSSGNVLTTVDSDPPSLTVDLVARASTTVVLSGQSYTYGQAVALMQAVLAQERALQLSGVSGSP